MNPFFSPILRYESFNYNLFWLTPMLLFPLSFCQQCGVITRHTLQHTSSLIVCYSRSFHNNRSLARNVKKNTYYDSTLFFRCSSFLYVAISHAVWRCEGRFVVMFHGSSVDLRLRFSSFPEVMFCIRDLPWSLDTKCLLRKLNTTIRGKTSSGFPVY